MNHPVRRATLAALVVTLGLLLAPSMALAHAELETASPADGETVTGTPPMIEATYSEDLDPDGSSLVLVDADGTELARGGPVGDPPTSRMSITDLPELAPGEYTVRSTTKSADDGDLDRVTWAFTVIAPSPTPTAQASVTASPAVTAPPVVTASPAVTAPAVASSASPGAPTPVASAGGADGGSNSGDAIVPIIAGLAIVAAAAIVLVRRRSRTTPSS